MQKVKRALRVIAFICLIALAVIGVGLSGGIPVSTHKNRRERETEKTELVQEKDLIKTVDKK